MAIFIHRKVKYVPLPKYEVDEVEAVWAEVMHGDIRLVVGSGENFSRHKFGEQLSRIMKENENVLVGMNTNGRNSLWDNYIIQNQFAANHRMGDILLDILIENQLRAAK